jgi:hypothetical protein
MMVKCDVCFLYVVFERFSTYERLNDVDILYVYIASRRILLGARPSSKSHLM